MTTPVTIELDEATLTALDDYAARVKRPRSELVNRVIKEFVALQTWQLDKVEKGIAAAERGDFASDEEVSAVFARHGVAY